MKIKQVIEKESLKITLSLGMIAIYIGLLKMLIDFTDTTHKELQYPNYIAIGLWGISILLLILYVVFTAVKYRSTENFSFFFISDQARQYLYDLSFLWLELGILFVVLGSLVIFIYNQTHGTSFESMGYKLSLLIWFLFGILLLKLLQRLIIKLSRKS